jgi:hydroxymethylpyrimidine pyrophosphatase-like HAD family hydrolase
MLDGMTQIKLVLTDLDGTVVLPETHSASDRVITSIREAEKQGVTFAAVTGRPFWMAKDLLQNIGFNGPSIFEGGGLILNPLTEEVLWSRSVPVVIARQVVTILMQYASIMEYGTNGGVAAQDADPSSISKPPLSIWASVPAEAADALVGQLRQLSQQIAVHANPGPGGDFMRTGIQITHTGADKEHAVHALLELLDVDKAHTLAIGDGNNDLPLFRAATLKVAMDNGAEALKQAADHVVASVTQDGFAEAIQKFVL